MKQWILALVAGAALLGAGACDGGPAPWNTSAAGQRVFDAAAADAPRDPQDVRGIGGFPGDGGGGSTGTRPADAGLRPDAPADACNSSPDSADGPSSPDTLSDGGPSPTVDYVSPYVAYLGEQQGVIIRGSGFAATATVLFGGHPAASVEVKSDTEIHAVPPVLRTAGRLSVTIGNDTGTKRSNADLVVRSHPNYPYTALATGVGFQDRHVLYDAERDAVFSYCSWFGNYEASTPSTINRYAYDPAGHTWTKTSSFVPSLWDIAMSPDGKYLIALGTSRLWLLDPVTFATLGYAELTKTGLGTASQLGVANDGKVLIRDLGLAYSLVSKTFTSVVFPGSIGIVFSADGSRAVVGDANTSADVPLSIYDAGTGLVTPSHTFEYFQLPSLDRTGRRYFSGGNLRDERLVLIGGVPTYLGYMPPDATRAYEIDTNDRTRIRAYDLSGNGPTFQRVADIVITDAIAGFWLQASLDSQYLFIPGPDKFIVVPVP